MTSDIALIALVILNENMNPNTTANILNRMPKTTVVCKMAADLLLIAVSGTDVTTVMSFFSDL